MIKKNLSVNKVTLQKVTATSIDNQALCRVLSYKPDSMYKKTDQGANLRSTPLSVNWSGREPNSYRITPEEFLVPEADS